MVGIGDNLYTRPFIRAIAKEHSVVYLKTGFPQLFEDIRNVRLVRAQSSLPYVMKNIREWGETHDWRGAPWEVPREVRMEPRSIGYDQDDPENVVDQILAKFPIHDFPF